MQEFWQSFRIIHAMHFYRWMIERWYIVVLTSQTWVSSTRSLMYGNTSKWAYALCDQLQNAKKNLQIPQSYLAANWPIRFSSLSSDGRLIAVAGRRGLVHYSSTSGRWKVFGDIVQEQAFSVRGGLLWFHHVLIASVEVSKSYQVFLFFEILPLCADDELA